jgi:predicted permease
MNFFGVQWNHVVRRLARSPQFTAITLLTLAIGIGANTAIFSVVDGVLLKPLPYPHAEELVAVWQTAPGLNRKELGISPSLYFIYRQENRTFQDIGMWLYGASSVTGVVQPEQMKTLRVTEGTLPLLGIHPILGREFSQQDVSSGSPETVLLAHWYWQTRFGGDAAVIGRRILVDGIARQVIGVLPQSFRFLHLKPGLVLPFHFDRSKLLLGDFSYLAVARLKPGVTVEQASADVARMIPMNIQRFQPPPGYSVKLFEDARIGPNVRPLHRYLVGEVDTMLWVLMGSIGLVLLIACANVANLLLVRTEGRQQELAIRAALGAGASQIARELLLESVALGLIGGVLGLGLAYWALKVLIWAAPANVPRIEEISINPVVLLFTLAISLAAGVLFGLIPVFKYVGPNLANSLHSSGRSSSQSRERHRARSTMVVVQVALALVLLICSGLMIRTFQAMRNVQPGFTQPEELQAMRISIPRAQVAGAAAVMRMEQDILEKIRAVPGVSSAGMVSAIPMDDQAWANSIFVKDRSYADGQIPPLRHFKVASPGLFRTMGNRLLAGRDFEWQDSYDLRNVAIVSENTARELWGNSTDALGRQIRDTAGGPWREVVGVVADEYDDGLNRVAPSIVYWPTLMQDFGGIKESMQRSMTYVVRSRRTGSAGFIEDISRAVWAVNPTLPVADTRTMEFVYRKSLALTSLTMTLLLIASSMALLLGIVGVYGVISYTILQRRREIGIRMAIGASRQELTGMFVRDGLVLASIGVACGLIAAVLLSRALKTLLFEVSPVDPLTYGAVVIFLVAATIIASYIPARRATEIDPAEALRADC